MSRRRWFQDESGRVHTPLEPVVLVATFALIPVLVVESDVESGGWLTVAYVANWVIWGLFAVELAAVLIVATVTGDDFMPAEHAAVLVAENATVATIKPWVGSE